MDWIKDICIEECNVADGDECSVDFHFHTGESETRHYEAIENLEIGTEGVSLKHKIIRSVTLPPKDQLQETQKIKFEDCIFPGDCDWNLHDFNSDLFFKSCIFAGDFILFGDFRGVVSFEASTFLGAKASFQECTFQHFVYNRVTLDHCVADFQETTFYSSYIFFGNMSINSSRLLFQNSYFPKNAELFDMLGTVADAESKILFQMVDFSFTEVRMFHSDIAWLEFLDCTFECNRFEFDFSCNTLIMQDCKNFRVLTLYKLLHLENWNIYNFVNTGRVQINSDPAYYMAAIESAKPVIWKRGSEYGIPESSHHKNELFALIGFFDLSQSECVRAVRNEISVIEKLEHQEKWKNHTYDGMKIFMSYSWSDDELANDIDKRFAEHGITLIRDRRDLNYRSSIKEFMKQIREGDYALILISDNYLKSVNCMYEVTELIKDDNYRERILPILKRDAKIFRAIDRTGYIRYWQDEYMKLKAESSDIEESNKIDNIKEMIRLERIERELPDFMSNLSDMNLIICDDHITDEDFDKMQVILFDKI